jgi:hypothetical protein
VEADEQLVLYSGRVSWLHIVFSANSSVFSSLKVIFRQTLFLHDAHVAILGCADLSSTLSLSFHHV